MPAPGDAAVTDALVELEPDLDLGGAAGPAGSPRSSLPRRLYFIWERQPWAVAALDFSQDRRDWLALDDDRRAMLIRSMAPFFAAEERVASLLAPVILAADDDDERAFLATQQADEARHMLFFERFWREAFRPDPEAAGSAIQDARARCNEAFTELFDRRLTQAMDRLRADPRDVDAKVEAVAIYHLIVEGTLGMTGMHFVIDFCARHAILPGIAQGLRLVRRDELRHVAWGTWYLRERCREDERYGQIVQRAVTELLPVAASVFVEGGIAVCDGLDPCEFLDYPSPQLNYVALSALARRLKTIGGATKEVQSFAASGAWRASRVA